MAQQTIDEEIEDLEAELSSYRTMLLNQSGYKRISGAGNEGAATEFTDPTKIKQLRQEARDRLATLRRIKSSGARV